MWNLPGSGFEPVSLALAGRFLSTVPPGKSSHVEFKQKSLKITNLVLSVKTTAAKNRKLLLLVKKGCSVNRKMKNPGYPKREVSRLADKLERRKRDPWMLADSWLLACPCVGFCYSQLELFSVIL